MKKIACLFLVLAMGTITPYLASAHGSDKDRKKDAKAERVYCCHGKGDCDKLHTKAECEKDGGKVVQSCKECK